MMARAERDQLGLPLTRWDSLAPELHRAGLVAANALMTSPQAPTGDYRPAARREAIRRAAIWLQAAAALLLVGGGVAAGRLTVGASPVPFGRSAERGETAARFDRVATPPGDPGIDPEAARPEFSSVADAIAALRRYEDGYQQAAAYLAVHDTTTRVDASDAYRTRLAALDRAGRAMSDALREAPYDPVINGYYLTTLGQREATLRQLDTALPDGYRLRSF
jgi:hypothetical protein